MRNTEIFWNLVKEIGWGTKTTDNKMIKRTLRKEYNEEFIKSMKDIAVRQRRALATIMDEHALKETGNITGYWDVSDDSFWDLTAHIVGLGKEVYDFICKNPIYAKTIEYKENFEYCFSIKYDYSNAVTIAPSDPVGAETPSNS
jgi:hypothetical protein